MPANAEPNADYHIDLEWYEENNRSLPALAKSRLCPDCVDKLGASESVEDILKAFQDCCSKKPEYLLPRMPVLESLFRVLLANGNEPLGLEELAHRIGEARQGNFVPGIEALRRILDHDKFYGLSALETEEPAEDVEEESEEEVVVGDMEMIGAESEAEKAEE